MPKKAKKPIGSGDLKKSRRSSKKSRMAFKKEDSVVFRDMIGSYHLTDKKKLDIKTRKRKHDIGFPDMIRSDHLEE
jgi:hypothetical protein